MDKNLTQDAINRLSRVAAEGGGKSKATAKGRNYAPFVFGKASSITKQQVRDVAQIHEPFIYTLANRLSSNLQVGVEIVPASVDELPYSEFVEMISTNTYLASMDVRPAHSLAILSLDLSIALAMVDLMLGGNGKPAPVKRHITEIEEKVLQVVLDMICEELQTAWRRVVEISFLFDQSRRRADLFRLLPSYDKILFLTFEIRIGSLSDALILAFPSTTSSLLVRNLRNGSTPTIKQSTEFQGRLQEKLEESVFDVELLLPPTRIRARDLLSLEAGQVLLIPYPIDQTAGVHIASRKMFSAYPVRMGSRRGGVLQEKFSTASQSEKGPSGF